MGDRQKTDVSDVSAQPTAHEKDPVRLSYDEMIEKARKLAEQYPGAEIKIPVYKRRA